MMSLRTRTLCWSRTVAASLYRDSRQVSGGKSQTEAAALKEQKAIFCLVCVPQVMM
jgi:hypothetical protein